MSSPLARDGALEIRCRIFRLDGNGFGAVGQGGRGFMLLMMGPTSVCERADVLRIEINGPAEISNGTVAIAQTDLDDATAVEGRAAFGIEAYGGRVVPDCSIRVVRPAPRGSPLHVGERVGRIQLDGLIVVGNCSGEIVLVRPGVAAQRVRAPRLRIQAKSSRQICNRAVDLTLFEPRKPSAVVCKCVCRIDGQGP